MKVLITAGPTREDIDPVRFISNRSTGRMGYALADEAVACGHNTRLISGPVCLAAPDEAELIKVTSAADMLAAVMENLDWCDVLIMSAAVADWRPKVSASRKLKKSEMSGNLELERTADILAEVAKLKKPGKVIIGFAAETGDPLPEGQRKLREKRLDMIVANDVSRPDAGFVAETNAVTLITPEAQESLPLMTKREVAAVIISRVEKLARNKK